MDNSARVYDAPTQVKLEAGFKKMKLDPLQGILNFVYKEMQNPSIVDTEGFKEMIMQVHNIQKQNYNMPNIMKFHSQLPIINSLKSSGEPEC